MLERLALALAATALLAGCAGWEGPSHWLQEHYLVGRPKSGCFPARGPAADAYPVQYRLDRPGAGWTGEIRAQGARCIIHTDPLGASGAAWSECRVDGPALVTHGSRTFVAPAGAFELRANTSGLSCRPL